MNSSEIPAAEGPIYDAITVGLGPSGLVMSAMLARAGHTVAAVERHPGLYGLPRAGHIDHEIMRILQLLDAHHPVLADSYAALEYVWKNADGETLLEFDWAADGISGWHSDYMQYQPVLEEALADRLKAIGGVSEFRGWEVVEIAELTDHVAVTIARSAPKGQQASGERRTLRGRYLIGADGAGSFVRRSLGIEREDLGFNERWLDVDARKKRDFVLDFDCGQICDPARPLTVLPLGQRHRRWEWALFPSETVEEFERPERAWALLDDIGIGPDDVDIVRQIVYTFEARIADEFQRGRIFLIGDSAHTMPPFMGQGMCSGFRDAVNLSWKLDLVLDGRAEASLLNSYQLERRPHVYDWTVISIESGKIPCVLDPEEAKARDQRFRDGWLPPFPDFPKLVDGVLLGADEHSVQAPAGDLSLQARVRRGDSVGLFDDVVGTGWMVITDSASALDLAPDQQRVLDVLGGRVVALVPPGAATGSDEVEDVDGAYAAYFELHGIHAVIVRPDFYVYGVLNRLEDLPGALATLAGQLQLAAGAVQV